MLDARALLATVGHGAIIGHATEGRARQGDRVTEGRSVT